MWDNLKASIASVVRTNNNQEITGANLQNVLNTIVNSVGANATFAGIAVPSTNPGTPDGPVFYIAGQAGVYTNFNLTITDGLYVFENTTGSWVGHDLEVSMLFASGQDVTSTNIAATYSGAGNNDLVTVGAMNEALAGIVGSVALSDLDSTRTAGLYRVIGVQSRVVGYLQVNTSLSGTYVIQFLASDISDFDDGYVADYKGHILTRSYSISGGTWSAWDEYGGGKFASGEKVADVSIAQTLGNSQTSVSSQKAVTDAIYNLIDIANIDAMKNDATLRTGGALARYTVTTTLQGVTYKVGILDVVSDSAGHVLTQILTTHYTITRGVLDTSSHSDGAVRQYYRSVKINGGTLPTTDWTLWKPINDELLDEKQDVISDLATIREGASAGATALQESDIASITDNTPTIGSSKLITSGGVAEEIYTSQTLGYDYTDFTWKNNYRLVNGEESYAQYYVCTTNYAPCSMIITYTKGSRNYNFHFALYDKDKVWISNLNDPWGDIPANAAYFKIYTDNLWGGGVINDGMTISTYSYTSIKNTVDELKEYIEGVDYVENVVYDVNDFTWESGTITNGSDAADNYSSRSVGYTPLNPIYFVLTKGNKQISNYGCSFYDSDKVFLSSASNPTSAPAKAAFFRLTVKHWGTPQNVINDNFFVNTKKVWDLIEYVPEMAARIDRNKGNADFALISKFRYIITSFGYGQEMLILFGSNNMVDWSYISMPYYPISNGATMVRDPSIIQIGKWYYIIYSYSATSQSMTRDLRMGVTRTENFTDFEDLPNLTAVDANGDPFVGTEYGSWAPAWCKIGQTIYICVSVDKQLTIYEYHPSTHTITYIAQPVIGSFTWTIDSHLYKYNNYYYLIGLGSNSRAYIAKSATIDGTYTVVSTNLNTQSEGEKCIMLDDGRWLMIMQASWKEGKPMMYSICSDGFEGEWSTPQDITIDDAYIASLIPSHADVMDRIHFGTGYDL